ncbi:hypothetical protein A5684_03685 [Mycobacterium intracellulare]|uniref:hypothetical protein n=1 Tax=Mycobacterium intracellulare TaxID=1767 RepID=UPI0007E9C61A|nr:hypothetical protein [Mycobacterium intracellulare]OBH67831.1 hypothetical protein A5684_03685 [Mycobacterium intracellulare]
MTSLESSPATEPLWPTAGLAVADWAIATAAVAQVRLGSSRGSGIGDGAVVNTRTLRWPASEDEIARAAIAVIFVAMTVIMALAASAILTMG